ncbi:MAG: pitrilysin family protein [Candidatus Omnitrophota bacterium]|nr:insulinase family protein [Candidatus Omnitrophota bacterium]
MHKKTVLDNGLKVVTHNMPARQSAALGIWIKAGGRYESSEFKGISHFLEHLLFKGSIHYSCRQIKESVEGVGGALNGFTSEELTCYLVKIPADSLVAALDILADMVNNPLILSEDVEKERTVILEEIKMYKDLPQSYVHELLDELLWPNHPLGMSIAGSLESVRRIQRNDLYSYKTNYYNASNIVVSAAGNLEHAKLVAEIEKRFDKRIKEKPATYLPPFSSQKKPQAKLMYKDTEQTHIALGFTALKREHPLRYALMLLHIILGANMSSRLFNEIREKRGLAYEIGTQLKRFQDTGAFVVHAGMDNNKVQDCLVLILKELGKITQKNVLSDEFSRAKKFMLGQLMLSLEDTMDNMLWIGESESMLKRIYTLADIIKQVAKTKVENLKEVGRLIFKEENINLALIGPVKDEDKLIQLLELR